MDLTYLQRMCKGDSQRMSRYIGLYLQEAPALFDQLEEALRSGNGETLATCAHTLRPQARYMGGTGLFSMLTTLEIRARARGAEACADLVAEACAENVRLMDSLRSWKAPV
ncbi:MAG: Hpt domain-containing protein [Flavobacteriales bacterium]|nr:Hpt domain-containing protein [Flavobacteriales bacterium]